MTNWFGPWHSNWLASLTDETSVEVQGEATHFSGPTGNLSLRTASLAAHDLAQGLSRSGSTIGSLIQRARGWPIATPQARLLFYLQKLVARGFVCVSANSGEDRLASMAALSDAFVLPPPNVEAERWVLSRFALVRRDLGKLVVESPCSSARIVLHDPRAASLLYDFATPQRVADLAGGSPGLSDEAKLELVQLLASAQILVPVGDREVSIEDSSGELKTWEFHDLLFHMRSRGARFDGPIGGLFRFAADLEMPPLVKPLSSKPIVPLFRPNLDSPDLPGPSFVRVVEGRFSAREFGVQPMTADELGEFLFRVARIKEQYEFEAESPTSPVRIETTTRPYPSGGGLYELEFYPLVQNCSGLEAGLYHYDPLDHQLEMYSPPSAETSYLLNDAAYAAGIAPENIQVLMIVSSRFQRLAWKYSGVAYALMLKHVGVVYELMYLTATAMGLGPCGLGLGDPEVFSRAIESNIYEESSVGEFLLGSLPRPIALVQLT